MLELMARGGMRVGEVLKLTPGDVQECSLSVHNHKSGGKTETVYVPRKILGRQSQYVQATGISPNDWIFPISYVAAWSMVKKAGLLVVI
jgi:integrase/recombinase XerD